VFLKEYAHNAFLAFILVFDKKVKSLFIVPKARQKQHEMDFTVFNLKNHEVGNTVRRCLFHKTKPLYKKLVRITRQPPGSIIVPLIFAKKLPPGFPGGRTAYSAVFMRYFGVNLSF